MSNPFQDSLFRGTFRRSVRRLGRRSRISGAVPRNNAKSFLRPYLTTEEFSSDGSGGRVSETRQTTQTHRVEREPSPSFKRAPNLPVCFVRFVESVGLIVTSKRRLGRQLFWQFSGMWRFGPSAYDFWTYGYPLLPVRVSPRTMVRPHVSGHERPPRQRAVKSEICGVYNI